MGRLLHFDCFNGVSGDMLLGALLDLGMPVEHLREELSRLGLEGYRLLAEPVRRQGLSGCDLKVELQQVAPKEGHQHAHSRGLLEIREMIESSGLSPWVRKTALAIFERLGKAEAAVHGSSLEEVHFHEVGAVDSIVDIVGACIGFQYFEVEEFSTGTLSLGSGVVTFSHGTWPVPTPATLELVQGFPVRLGEVEGELTTPTGAAVVTTLARPGSPAQTMIFERAGLGAGDRRFEEIPNMLRLLLGRPAPGAVSDQEAWQEEEIQVVEAEIDDLDAETLGYFMERALEEGALDVFSAPLVMKKGRPGQLLTLLCREGDLERFLELIFRETTTLGARWMPWRRAVLRRRVEQAATPWGDVSVKVGWLGEERVTIAPEFEELKAAARRAGIPLKRLRQMVVSQIRKRESG